MSSMKQYETWVEWLIDATNYLRGEPDGAVAHHLVAEFLRLRAEGRAESERQRAIQSHMRSTSQTA
jgi:hypothetical protein